MIDISKKNNLVLKIEDYEKISLVWKYQIGLELLLIITIKQ